MTTHYDPTLKANVTLDDSGRIREINHLDEYREMEHLRGRDAATAYVREIAGKLNIAQEALNNLEQAVSYIPKLVLMVLALSFTLPWAIETFVEYARELIETIPDKL